MAEINEQDALQLAVEYFRGKNYPPEDIDRVLTILERVDIEGLIIYVYNQGARDSEAEK